MQNPIYLLLMAKKKNQRKQEGIDVEEAEAAGWYGTAAILLAYGLVSFELISANGTVFQLLNLSGALGIIIISVRKNVKQSVVLNVIWAIVALIALVRAW